MPKSALFLSYPLQAPESNRAAGGLDYDYGAKGLNYIPLHVHSE